MGTAAGAVGWDTHLCSLGFSHSLAAVFQEQVSRDGQTGKPSDEGWGWGKELEEGSL